MKVKYLYYYSCLIIQLDTRLYAYYRSIVETELVTCDVSLESEESIHILETSIL